MGQWLSMHFTPLPTPPPPHSDSLHPVAAVQTVKQNHLHNTQRQRSPRLHHLPTMLPPTSPQPILPKPHLLTSLLLTRDRPLIWDTLGEPLLAILLLLTTLQWSLIIRVILLQLTLHTPHPVACILLGHLPLSLHSHPTPVRTDYSICCNTSIAWSINIIHNCQWYYSPNACRCALPYYHYHWHTATKWRTPLSHWWSHSLPSQPHRYYPLSLIHYPLPLRHRAQCPTPPSWTLQMTDNTTQ